jgi:hypothetical protein
VIRRVSSSAGCGILGTTSRPWVDRQHCDSALPEGDVGLWRVTSTTGVAFPMDSFNLLIHNHAMISVTRVLLSASAPRRRQGSEF